MTYDIQKITDREMWEGFLREVRPDTFLQSWGWGSFQESQGDSVVRFGIFTQERLCAVALFIEVHARRGRFLLCPHGPVIHPSYAQQTERFLTQFFEAARATAKDRHIDFIRVASLLFDTPAPRAFFFSTGFSSLSNSCAP